MYWIKRLLVYLGILRVVDLMYNNGEIRQGEIVDEDGEDFCIKSLRIWGRHGGWFADWISKSDPAIRGIHWNPRAKFALAVVLCLMVVTPYVLVNNMVTVDYGVFTEVDTFTGLPVAGHVFYPERLPDGHYTVAEAMLHGETIVIRHRPGPDRNFVYYVMNRFAADVPDCKQFTVFRGKTI